MSNKGHFVISLDFELYWGMFDKVTIQQYNKNIKGTHSVIPKILDIFETYDVHATWASVGMLMYDNQFTLATALPPESNRPNYKNENLSSYKHIEKQILQLTEMPEIYFAHNLLNKIIKTNGQEIASHTFSHYYCMEDQTKRENTSSIFYADCIAFNKALSQFGITTTSIIFPRNQWTKEALNVCAKNGITAYRGNENHFLYRARIEKKQTNIFIRGIRLIDHYINISGHHTYSMDKNTICGLVNIKSSRQLRPYSRKLSLLEPLRLHRIKRSMTHAAKQGEIFHLWWHPHNFGINQKENLKNLSEIIMHYQTLKEKYGMQSSNMHELATKVIKTSKAE